MRFFTKSGWLTVYALACGYIESVDSETITLVLEHNGRQWDVRGFDHAAGRRVCWETFERLPGARKYFSETAHRLGVARRKLTNKAA
jgi:ActR/RegA family two-component response regulator